MCVGEGGGGGDLLLAFTPMVVAVSGKSLRVTSRIRQRWRVSEDSSRGGGMGGRGGHVTYNCNSHIRALNILQCMHLQPAVGWPSVFLQAEGQTGLHRRQETSTAGL